MAVTSSQNAKKQGGTSARLSFTLSSDKLAELERIAKRRKVAVAWVVRDAVDRYLDRDYPLLTEAN